MTEGSQRETHGLEATVQVSHGRTMTQRAAETYPCSQTESAEETGVLTPKRLHFLLIIVRAAGEGRRASSMQQFKGVRKKNIEHSTTSLV